MTVKIGPLYEKIKFSKCPRAPPLCTGTSLVLPDCLQSNISHGKNCNHCNKQSVSAQFLVSSKVIKSYYI